MISVVIPTHEDPHSLELMLGSLARQTVPASEFEVVVVRDGGKVPYTLADGDYGLQLKYHPLAQNQGRAGARNHGIRQASGDIIVFLDSDSLAVPTLIERHAEHHRAAPGPSVLVGKRYEMEWSVARKAMDGKPIDPAELSSRVNDTRFADAEAEREANRYLRQSPWLFTFTHNISLPRQTLVDVGMFDEKFGRRWGYEDIELFYRVQQLIGRESFSYDADAAVYHLPHLRDVRRSLADYYGRLSQMKRKYPTIDWELLGTALNLHISDKIERYRRIIEHCATRGHGRLAPIYDALREVMSDLPDDRRGLYIAFGTEEVQLPVASHTFDHGRKPSPRNRLLLGMDMPYEDDSFDVAVNVDLWRYLHWDDLCLFVGETLRVAGTGYLGYTHDLTDDTFDILDDEAYLLAAFAQHAQVRLHRHPGVTFFEITQR